MAHPPGSETLCLFESADERSKDQDGRSHGFDQFIGSLAGTEFGGLQSRGPIFPDLGLNSHFLRADFGSSGYRGHKG